MSKALWSLAVGSLIITSCCLSPRTEGADPKPVCKENCTSVCNEKACNVTVRVSACAITVQPEWLGVRKGNRNVEIVWEIRDSPGVTFAKSEPIFFKPESSAAASKQFSSPQPSGPTKYRWLNANTAPGSYYYGIRVVDNGKDCPPLDPVIIDEM